MRPKLPKLASLAQKICILWFQLFDAFFAFKGYPFKNIFDGRTSSYMFFPYRASIHDGCLHLKHSRSRNRTDKQST